MKLFFKATFLNFLLLSFVLSSTAQDRQKSQTGLIPVIDSMLDKMKGNWPYAICYNSFPTHDLEFIKLKLQQAKSFDFSSDLILQRTDKDCNGIKETIWMALANWGGTIKIQKQEFISTYKLFETDTPNTVSITDYIIHRNTKPFYVLIRIADNKTFKKLVLDAAVYLPNAYERIINKQVYKPYGPFALEILGFIEVQELLEVAKLKCR